MAAIIVAPMKFLSVLKAEAGAEGPRPQLPNGPLRVIKAFTERANFVMRLFRVQNFNISMLAIFDSEVIMRRSNYFAPIPPGSPGVREKMCLVRRVGN